MVLNAEEAPMGLGGLFSTTRQSCKLTLLDGGVGAWAQVQVFALHGQTVSLGLHLAKARVHVCVRG